MKKFYNFLSFTWLVALAILLSTGGAQAQTYTVVPTGGTAGNTNGFGSDPVDDYFKYMRYQVVYTAAELSASGLVGGSTITAVGWNVTELPGTLSNYTIKMGTTTASNSATHDASPTTVVKTAFSFTPESGWNMITLSTTFVWNGTSNILVEVCTGSNPFASPYGGVQAKTGVTNGSRYVRDDTSDQCSTNTSSTNTTKPYFGINATPPPCTGTPAPGNTVSSANPVCSGVNFNLSLQNPTSGSGVTYQWVSADDAAFTVGVTNLGTASTQTTSQTSAKYYRCNVTCTNSGMSAYSNALQVTMNSPTYATYNNVSYTESFESWVNGCNTSDRPSAAWENSPNTGNASWRRNDQGSTAAWGSPTSGVYSPVFTDGSYSARFHSYNASSGTKGSLSLYVNMTAATGNTRLSFDHINTSGSDVLKVFLSTDGGVTFTQQGNNIGTSAVWTNKTFDFNSTSATTVIKLEATSDYGTTDIGIDKLKLEPGSACLATTATAATNITATTASANWSTATGSWIIEYGPTATFGTPGTGATAGNVNNSVVTASNVSTIGLTGLTPVTGYSYVVRHDCSGSGNGYSANSNVITFTTACNVVTSFPWAESFDNVSLPVCWTQQYVSGTFNWATVTTNGNSSITPHSGARMAEFRNTTTGSATRLVTPLLDLTSLTNPELTFYFANVNWVGDIDELRVYYSTDGGSTWTLIPGQTYTTEHASWQEVKVILPSPNSTYMVAFEGTSNYARGLDLDDVSIAEVSAPCTGTPTGGTASVTPSSGPSGSDATFAVSGYETGSSGLTYDWEYSTDGGTTWTSTGASGDNELFTMTGPHGTVFQIRYAVGCTPSGMTGYSNVVTFTIDNTNCVPPDPANGCIGDNITSVSLLTLSDPGQTCTPLYEDRTGSQNAVPGLTREVPISMSVGVGTGGTEYVGVWIDSDGDGLFENDEFTALGSGNGVTVTGNIMIPAGTHAGDVKMRVRTKYDAAFAATDACAQVGYGSTRDYTVTILRTNDECSGAIAISSDPITDFIDPGTQYMAFTSKSSVPDGSCFTTSPSSKDMWYKITTNGNNGSVLNLTVAPDASMDVALTLFEGTCGTLNAVACSNVNAAGVAENMGYTLPLWDGGIEVRDNKVYFLRVTDIGGNGTSFTIGNNGSTALPLTLLSFKAQQVKRGEVLLDWRVKDEVNMKQYIVERSIDGKHFAAIGTVSSLGKETYSLIDPRPASGINYYRLAMVESNGLTNYSHTVAININEGKALHASPNPVTGDLTVEVKGEVGKQAVIDIIDYTGNKVRTVAIPAGKVTVDMASLPTGVYVVQYIDGTTVYTTRVVKM